MNFLVEYIWKSNFLIYKYKKVSMKYNIDYKRR